MYFNQTKRSNVELTNRMADDINNRKVIMKTDRVEELFKNGLTHGIADVVFARIFTALPLLITAEVEHLRHVVQYQFTNCLSVLVFTMYDATSKDSPQHSTTTAQHYHNALSTDRSHLSHPAVICLT